MAMDPAFFDLLNVNDGDIPSFLPRNESDEIFLALLDAKFGEELQFQEALEASLISCQMPSNGSSTPQSKTNMEAISGHKMDPRSCDICLETKGNDQIIKNESSGEIICLDCSNIFELSKKERCSKDLNMGMSSSNDTGKSPTADASNSNTTPKTETEPGGTGAVKVISLNSAQDEGKSGFYETKHGKIAETIAAKDKKEGDPESPKEEGHENVHESNESPSEDDKYRVQETAMSRENKEKVEEVAEKGKGKLVEEGGQDERKEEEEEEVNLGKLKQQKCNKGVLSKEVSCG